MALFHSHDTLSGLSKPFLLSGSEAKLMRTSCFVSPRASDYYIVWNILCIRYLMTACMQFYMLEVLLTSHDESRKMWKWLLLLISSLVRVKGAPSDEHQGQDVRKRGSGESVKKLDRASREQFLISVCQKPSIWGSEAVSDGRECADTCVLLTPQ